MIHHLSFSTNDAKRAREFYDPVLAVISLRLLERDERSLHYGTGDILLSLVAPVDGCAASPGNGVHVAFAARDRQEFRARTRRSSACPRLFWSHRRGREHVRRYRLMSAGARVGDAGPAGPGWRIAGRERFVAGLVDRVIGQAIAPLLPAAARSRPFSGARRRGRPGALRAPRWRRPVRELYRSTPRP
jgi:hypothetical protein